MFIVSGVYLIIFFLYFYKDIKNELYIMFTNREIDKNNNDSEMEMLIEKNNEQL